MSTPPTEIAFTRTFGASSAARLRVIMLSAALPARVGDERRLHHVARARRDVHDRAAARASRPSSGRASRVSRNALVTLKRSAFSKKRSLVCERGRAGRCRPRCSRARRGARTPRTAAFTSALELPGLHHVARHHERAAAALRHLGRGRLDVGPRARGAHDVRRPPRRTRARCRGRCPCPRPSRSRRGR